MERLVRILVLDHDARSRQLVCAALSSEGRYETVAASGVQDGLDLLQKDPAFDLVVTDPIAPTGSAGRPIGLLRALNPSRPILVYSTVFNQRSVAQAMALGADDYLSKPVDLVDLRRAVAQLTVARDPAGPALANGETGKLVVRAEGEGMYVEMLAPTGSPHVDRFQCFVCRLMAAWLPKDDYLNLRLAMEESVVNAAEWGNRNNPAKQIKLSYCLLPDRVTVRVEDQGAGFDPAAVPDPTLDPIAHLKNRKKLGKRVGGWGVLLTKKSVDEVRYNAKGNVVHLTKLLKRGNRGQPVRKSRGQG